MFNSADFYPTPKKLIRKMMSKIDIRTIKTILEPSAGKGDLVESLIEEIKIHERGYNKDRKYDIDCVEIDENLRHVLHGKGYRVIHDDFLTFDSFKKYDLIFANFPFSTGDKHMIKALELIKQGGTLIGIINASTLENPYSNVRNDLLDKLEYYNANIEYIDNAFIDAERKTGVRVALVTVKIENNHENSFIIDRLKQEDKIRQEAQQRQNQNTLIDGDFIKGIIQQYQFELRAGLKLINEYKNIKPLMLTSFNKDNYKSDTPILKLSTKVSRYGDVDDDRDLENNYIKRVREKYWTALFTNEKFTKRLTSNLLEEYRSKISELVDYDFSLFNIKEIQRQMSSNLVQGVKDTILKLFDEFTHEHTWYPETCKNKLHYNGWKTNKASKVNKKVIIIENAFSTWDNSLDFDYRFKEKIQDIENVFNYLDDGNTPDVDLYEIFKIAKFVGQTKNIITKYFKITVYKKGTTHITFLNQDLLKKFNIFGGKNRNFLPPDYGSYKYSDLSQEEKEIVNNFEGEKEYNKTVAKKDYFLYDPTQTLLLNSGA